MRALVLLCAVLACSSAQDPKADAQYINIKSVKGGGQYQYRGGDNLHRFYNNTQTNYGAGFNHTSTAHVNHGVGVCFVEVPTASLARDPKHIPAGNGSRPDLSRIQTCCQGYIRNIHNFHLCDPVCTTECVNALCTAPDTCTCFPDHVKNKAGYCVATCPIGCQNGHCNGGQCLCKEGFRLDADGRFCVPSCRENCGGIGNCTAPNTCACNPGYHSTPDGSCKYLQSTGPHGAQPNLPSTSQCGSCINGDCVGTECRCRQGYLLYRGECLAQCYPSCGLNERCVAPNVCSPSSVPGAHPQNHSNPHLQNNTNHGQYPNQYPTQYPNPYPAQYPNQYPNGFQVYNQNKNNSQYPYPPNGQPNNQYPNNQLHNHTGNHPNANPAQPNPNPIYAQYPSGQPNQYPHGQPGQYPYPNQPNNQPNHPNHGQYPPQPNQQHLYPDLPQNNYPSTSNKTSDGQVFHQNSYNPLENVTFNLQQGTDHNQVQHNTGQFVPQQNQYPQGTYNGQPGQQNQGFIPYGQGQYTQGQDSQSQYSQGQFSQGQYSQGQYSQGQYSQGQYLQQGHHGQNMGTYGYSAQLRPNGEFVPQGQDQTQHWPDQASQCTQPCLNGNCVGPNRCECFPGYNLDQNDTTGTRCLPQCPGGCHNGYCSAPNTCACLPGYQKDFSVKGRPACVKRDRRSVNEEPVNVADLLVYEIPDYY